jgi:hypothetical protein
MAGQAEVSRNEKKTVYGSQDLKTKTVTMVENAPHSDGETVYQKEEEVSKSLMMMATLQEADELCQLMAIVLVAAAVWPVSQSVA